MIINLCHNVSRNVSNAKGYFVWSFVDLFELLAGYECSFGLYYVDFSDPSLTRYPKLSQRWYSRFLKGMNVIGDEAEYNVIANFQTRHPDVGDLKLLRDTFSKSWFSIHIELLLVVDITEEP